MAMVNAFAQIYKSKKGHNSIIIKARSMDLAIHMYIVSDNICAKFYLNILYGLSYAPKLKCLHNDEHEKCTLVVVPHTDQKVVLMDLSHSTWSLKLVLRLQGLSSLG